MRRSMKCLLFMIALIVALGLNVTTVCAEETVKTGKMGKNNGFTWSYDQSTKTLTVTGADSGLGSLYVNTVYNPFRYIAGDAEKIILQNCKISGGMSGAFYGYTSLKSVEFSNTDTSEVTVMSYMFSGCSNLMSVDVSGFDTSNVTNMSYMFSGCSNLMSVDVSGFDTSNVTDMGGMFSGCSSLTSVDVSGFDTSNVTNMVCMFSGCSSLTSVDVSGFDTSKVTDMYRMFADCSSMLSLDVSGFDTSNVTDMGGMFSHCISVPSLDVSGFDTLKVTDTSYMFSGCSSLTSLDVSGFDTSKVTRMEDMFYDCSNLTSLDVSGFDTSNVTNMGGMFADCSSLLSLDVSGFDTSKVMDMEDMFYRCNSVSSLDMSDFDTSKVTNTSYMLDDCDSLISLDTPKAMTTDQRISLPHTFKDRSGKEVAEITSSLCNTVLVSAIPTRDTFVLVADTTKLAVGEKCQLQLKLQGVMQNVSVNDNYNWSVTSNDVATVSPTGLVTAVGLGTTTIVVIAKEGNKDQVNGGIIDITVMPDGSILKQPISQTVVDGENTNFAVEAVGTCLSYQWQFKTVGTDKWKDSGMPGAKTNSITVQGTIARNGQQYRCVITNSSGEKITSNVVTLTVIPMISTGTLGDNNEIRWEYNAKTKTLAVSGTDSGLYGKDYYNYSYRSPFYSICSDVEYIVFDNCKPKGTVERLFSNLIYLKEVDFSGLDLSEVTDMYGMFSNCSSLSSVDVSGFNTTNVTNMGYLFSGCSKLTDLNLSGLDTACTENMAGMFYYCSNLTNLDLSGLDTSCAENMGAMFYGCSKLTNLDLSTWDTSKVTHMDSMFSCCSSLNSLDLSGFDTSRVTNMLCMFESCSSLLSLDLSGFDTSRVTNMVCMFVSCSSLLSLDLSGFDTSNVKFMGSMFDGCSSLTSLDLSSFDTSNVEFIDCMIYDCSSLISVHTPKAMDAGQSIYLPHVLKDTDGKEVTEITSVQCGTVLSKYSLQIGADTTELSKGQSLQMVVKLDNKVQDITDNTKYKWYSSSENVATVSENGVVTAVSTGSTTITCTMTNGLTADFEVTVVGNVGITSQPTSQRVTEGDNAVFEVTARGSNLSYQWQYKKVNENEWKNSGITGARTASLTVQGVVARNGQKYRCIITDGSGNRVTSNAVTLTVVSKLSITGQPANRSVEEGDSAVFKVTATGSNLSYQWQYKNAGTNKWFNSGMKGAKTDSITVQGTAARNGQQYRCIITDGSGNTLTSEAVTLTVEMQFAITAQPVNQTVAEGANAVFAVTVTGSNLSYQWQYKNAGTNKWFNSGMKGAKTSSITVQGTAARNGQQYRCIITDGSGNTLTSEAVTLTVEMQFAITAQPVNQTVAEGANAVFAVTVTGSNLSYQWQYKNAGADKWFNSGMKGAKTASITVQGTAARNGQQYRCIITDGSGNQVISDIVTLTVN